ncbi:MAG: hypothetical protein NC929_05005, partial [Candidatus Omnitrophica bacterium]|nr:hypothetical protein [Candidatus Omnitrophota bacterium]
IMKKNLPKEFKKLNKIENDFKKRLYFVGILTKYLKEKKIRPIIVGGHAVEFYTLGSYTTGDIDIVSEGQVEIESILKSWGFKKVDRLWVNIKNNITVDIVGSVLKGDDYSKISEITIEDMKVYIIGIEDLIIDRLNAFVWWKSEEDGRWAKQLLELHRKGINKRYLSERAKKEGIYKTLKKIQNEKI